MSEACRKSSTQSLEGEASVESYLSDCDGIRHNLTLHELHGEIHLQALEFRVRAARTRAERVEALADYAMTALVSGVFWKRGYDGSPLCHLIFDDMHTAVHVGRKVFEACQWVEDLDQTIGQQMGMLLAQHWRYLAANGLAEPSEAVGFDPMQSTRLRKLANSG